MSQQALEILNRSLQYSLWLFLLSFFLCLIFVANRLQVRQQRLWEAIREEWETTESGSEAEEWLPADLTRYPAWDQVTMAWRALWLSLGVALVAFLVFAFTPHPLFENFANRTLTKPLRLSTLNYDRFHEGFSLYGEVWNQGSRPLKGLQAIISIWGEGRKKLDAVRVKIDPDPLPAGASGTFMARYLKHSPQLYGYSVSFRQGDLRIPHTEGF